MSTSHSHNEHIAMLRTAVESQQRTLDRTVLHLDKMSSYLRDMSSVLHGMQARMDEIHKLLLEELK